MERRETSQLQSPFFPHPGRRDRVGQLVGWLLTGVGRAYLAFCPEQERKRIVSRLVSSDLPDDQLAREPERLGRILARTRERGYGTRDPIFTGGPHGAPPINDQLAAIAVPLQGQRRSYRSINLLWIKTAFSVEDFASRHLGDLQTAACEIVSAPKDRREQDECAGLNRENALMAHLRRRRAEVSSSATADLPEGHGTVRGDPMYGLTVRRPACEISIECGPLSRLP